MLIENPSITSQTSSIGSSTRDYANGIKDATAADGSRSQTAQNPLGLSSNKAGGKNAVAGGGRGKGSSGTAVGTGRQTAANPLGL